MKYLDITSGPNTVVAMFAYGDVKPITHECMLRDVAHAKQVEGAVIKQKQILRALHHNHINTDNLLASMPPLRHWPVQFMFPHDDALIDRSRAIVAKRFLEEMKDAEVLFMIDHDIGWRGRDKEYCGDILHLCRVCAEKRGIVGGLVSKKIRGQGVAVLWDPEGENATEDGCYNVGIDDLTVEVHAVGAAFTAYHRDVLQAVTETMDDIPPGFTPIFLPNIIDHPLNKDARLHLSEDWMFAHRAKLLGYKCWINTMPLTKHRGEWDYEVVRDSSLPPDEMPATARNMQELRDQSQKVTPNGTLCNQEREPVTFSLLHASRGRPGHILPIVKKWRDLASKKNHYEYIISIDEDDESMTNFDYTQLEQSAPEFSFSVVKAKNAGCVDAYNQALWKSEGDIIIQAHDDMEPPDNWDLHLLQSIPDVKSPILLHVNDGLPDRVNNKPWLIPIVIGTRAFFKQTGYLFHPDYISIYCDDDLSLTAIGMGCVKDAKHLTFKHNWVPNEQADETRKRSYAPQNWERGAAVLESRKAKNFPRKPELWK